MGVWSDTDLHRSHISLHCRRRQRRHRRRRRRRRRCARECEIEQTHSIGKKRWKNDVACEAPTTALRLHRRRRRRWHHRRCCRPDSKGEQIRGETDFLQVQCWLVAEMVVLLFPFYGNFFQLQMYPNQASECQVQLCWTIELPPLRMLISQL